VLVGVRLIVYRRALPLATRSVTIENALHGERGGVVGGIVLGVEAALAPEALSLSVANRGTGDARGRYELLPAALRDTRLLGISIVQNWIIAPILMFGLAAAFLHGRPDLFAGLVMVGLARCIAMVVVWSELASADREYTAALVAINSIFQVFGYAAYAYIFVTVLPPFIGLPSLAVHLSIAGLATSVLIYLGLPAVAGSLTRISSGHGWVRNDTMRASSQRSHP